MQSKFLRNDVFGYMLPYHAYVACHLGFIACQSTSLPAIKNEKG